MRIPYNFYNSEIPEKIHICFVIAPHISAVPIFRPPSLVCWFGNFSVTLSVIFVACKLMWFMLDSLIFIFFPNLWGAAYIQVRFIVRNLRYIVLKFILTIDLITGACD